MAEPGLKRRGMPQPAQATSTFKVDAKPRHTLSPMWKTEPDGPMHRVGLAKAAKHQHINAPGQLCSCGMRMPLAPDAGAAPVRTVKVNLKPTATPLPLRVPKKLRQFQPQEVQHACGAFIDGRLNGMLRGPDQQLAARAGPRAAVTLTRYVRLGQPADVTQSLTRTETGE